MGQIERTFPFLGSAPFRSRDGGISWRGPCPECGGEDRFLMFTDREYPDWNFECSLCEYKGWASDITGDKSNNGYKHDPKLIERLKKEKKRKQEENLRAFQEMRPWETFHAQLTKKGRRYWVHDRGIQEAYLDYWMLGETTYNLDGTGYLTFTIPRWVGDAVLNIDYRFLSPPDGGKYRSHPGLSPVCFTADKSGMMSSRLLVVEGAIKAMVTFQALENEFQVIGVPAASSWANIRDLAGSYKEITVILDPDARKHALSLARELGPGTGIIELPTKIDDGFNDHGLTKAGFYDIYKYSRRVPRS